MTYRPGEALRTTGWSSPYRLDSFTPEIDPIRDYVAILGPAELARRMQIEEQELNQFLTSGEAPSAYVGMALLGLQRRWQHQKVTWRSELRRPENLQLQARMRNGRGHTAGAALTLDEVTLMKRSNDKPAYTDARGKFAPGNPGRPRGARHKTSLAIEQLLDGEAEALTRKAVEMALEGDTTALRLCLERICPPRKDAPVVVDLPPMQSARDAADAVEAVIAAVGSGELTPQEGASVAGLIETYRRTLELTEIEERVAELERVTARL